MSDAFSRRSTSPKTKRCCGHESGNKNKFPCDVHLFAIDQRLVRGRIDQKFYLHGKECHKHMMSNTLVRLRTVSN